MAGKSAGSEYREQGKSGFMEEVSFQPETRSVTTSTATDVHLEHLRTLIQLSIS